MPATRQGFVSESNRQVHLNGINSTNHTLERQNYDSFETNPSNRDSIISAKKIISSNKKKSFWSSNLSLASSSSSQSSQANGSKQSIFNSSKKILRDLITRSPSPSSERKKCPILTRSQTMKPNERRRIFNRSSSRNFHRTINSNDSENLQTSQIQEQQIITTSTTISDRQQLDSVNIYDKLFINKKLNATNTKIVKQIDDELSPYSHIYKDFAVDCLRPFFQIEKIEKIQFDQASYNTQSVEPPRENSQKINSDYDEINTSIVTTGSTTSKSLNSSLIDNPFRQRTDIQRNPTDTNNLELRLNYNYNEELSEEHNSPSISLCLSSSSSNSFIVRSEENFKSSLVEEAVDAQKASTSCEMKATAMTATPEIPKPQPRSIYLTYENYKRNNQQLASSHQICQKENTQSTKVF